LKDGAVELPIEAAARAGGGGGQGGDTGCLEAKKEGMMVRHSWDVKGNTGTGLKEGRKVNTVKAGRGFTTAKPGELNLCREQDTKGVNITIKGNNIKKLLGKLSIHNKGKVLRVYLVNHTIEVPHQDGRHRPLKRGVQTAQHGRAIQHRSTAPAARGKVEMDEGEVAQLHQLGVARREGRHLHRNTGQDSDGPLGGGGGGGKEGRVPRRRQRQQGGVGGNFLDKGEVGAMSLE
jgi:hypothetical protein